MHHPDHFYPRSYTTISTNVPSTFHFESWINKYAKMVLDFTPQNRKRDFSLHFHWSVPAIWFQPHSSVCLIPMPIQNCWSQGQEKIWKQTNKNIARKHYTASQQQLLRNSPGHLYSRFICKISRLLNPLLWPILYWFFGSIVCIVMRPLPNAVLP